MICDWHYFRTVSWLTNIVPLVPNLSTAQQSGQKRSLLPNAFLRIVLFHEFWSITNCRQIKIVSYYELLLVTVNELLMFEARFSRISFLDK